MNLVLPQPDTAWPRPAALPRPLRLAIGLSIGVHALALLVQGSDLSSAPERPPVPLEIVLRAPAPVPAPPPVSLPPPAATPIPAPPPRVEAPPRPARPEPRPTPVLTRHAAQAPSVTPALRTEPAPAAPVNPVTPIAPQAAVTTETAAPPAIASTTRQAHIEPAPVVAPAADDALDPALLERYGHSLSSLFARQQNYPRLAAMRGWEGEVQVRVTIARKGNIVAAQVVRSSGFEVLDQSAIQLVSNAGPLPRPPDALQNRELQIVVPVLFKLEKPA